MFVHPHFDPVALQIGPLAIRWYGLMYLLAFVLVLVLGRVRIRQQLSDLSTRDLDDLLFFGMLGTILGGRLGYVFFYQFDHYWHAPLDALKVWQGGMSFHGGLIGVIVAMVWFARSRRYSFWQVSDLVAPLVPLGLAAGRFGNFINGELWGRPTSVPWGMVFPESGSDAPRHPSQLYELTLEGLVLFAILWWFSGKRRPLGAISGLFLIGYGCARFLVEFTREPDSFLGLLALGLSMGQWLSLPMIAAGIVIMVRAYRAAPSASPPSTRRP
ncbi:MAG: prolipoprotein diacylglyceryl transferase [Burkholderiaceae bacterium]|jgi:phosphatidylglycerol:prolipoprotein diacylglycerol transferase